MSHSPRLWDVYYFQVQVTAPPKKKFMIVTYVPEGAGYVLGILINSELNDYQERMQLQPCFAQIPVAGHPFLRYDSWAACGQVLTFSRHDLTPATLVGRINTGTAEEIVASALACRILKNGHKRNFAHLELP